MNYGSFLIFASIQDIRLRDQYSYRLCGDQGDTDLHVACNFVTLCTTISVHRTSLLTYKFKDVTSANGVGTLSRHQYCV